MADVVDESGDVFGEWVVLELMGHRRLGGYLTEQEIAGDGFLRLEIPAVGDAPAATQFYRPGAVYCITPVTQDMAMAVVAHSRPEPVSRWELPIEPTRLGDGTPSVVHDVDGEESIPF